jgi:alanine racemase
MPLRPCWVEISTGAFEDNYRFLIDANRAEPVELLAIVKADAYGHGLAHCAPAAVRVGARWLGVTSVEEAVAARALCVEAGFPETEILVIGGPFARQGSDIVAHRLTAVVWDPAQLDELESAAKVRGQLAVHLELDTGMSRQGVGMAELDCLLARLRGDGRLRVDGLMTHLYAADESDGVASREQLELLERMLERIFAAGIRPTWLHVGNSAAVMAGEVLRLLRELAERWGLRPMARPGLALYGLAPEFGPGPGPESGPAEPERVAELRPGLRRVLEWKTQVVNVRSIAAGDVVGYNGTFIATEAMQVALLAVGYADGLKRALSNCGYVLVGGQRAPIVGRISMDQTVVDVTEIAGVAAGDEVILLGRQGVESITAEEHAAWARTVPWEIFTSITARVERRRVD